LEFITNFNSIHGCG